MSLQDKINEINEKIEVLISDVKSLTNELDTMVENEFPQDGDGYWCIEDSTEVSRYVWEGDDFDNQHLPIGNVFRTQEQAQFAVEKLKVEAELRKFSRPFKEGENENWFILWGTYKKEVQIDWSRKLVRQGTIYFESRKKANKAIESVGEDRIKKYIFGVED